MIISCGEGAGLRYPGGKAGDRSRVLVRVWSGVTRSRSSRAGISASAVRVRRPPSGVTAPSPSIQTEILQGGLQKTLCVYEVFCSFSVK